MNKQTLNQWHLAGKLTNLEREALLRLGFNKQSYYLQDLKQALRCKSFAERNGLKNSITKAIKTIVFLNPLLNLEEEKLSIYNYSCALVRDTDNQVWLVVFRPSYNSEIFSDLIVQRVSDPQEAETKLNWHHPVLALAPSQGNYYDFVNPPYVTRGNFYRSNLNWPDRYLLPLDVLEVGRSSSSSSSCSLFTHVCVYLGNGIVCNYDSDGAHFERLGNLFEENTSKMKFVRSKIPFKRTSEIVEHLARATRVEYGKQPNVTGFWNGFGIGGGIVLAGATIIAPFTGGASLFGFGLFTGSISAVPQIVRIGQKNQYHLSLRNCQNFANRVVFGINFSQEKPSLIDRDFGLKEELWDSGADAITSPDLSQLCSQEACQSERTQIEKHIQEAQKNQERFSTNLPATQEQFRERIEVRPSPPCWIQ